MQYKKKRALLVCAIMTWMAMPVLADNVDESPATGGLQEGNSITTRDVNVVADQAKEAAKEESQQTTIITAEDIKAKQAKSVEDIIFHETGMTRQVDAMGRVTVSVRGAEPRHTLLMIDGQPVMSDVSKYSGASDELQRLGTENVERIEIVKGAASAKYGAGAIGGVINVVTKRASKTPSMEFNVEGRRTSGDGDTFPYQNFFLRADSGQQGNVRVALYGSKREILPVASKEEGSYSKYAKSERSLRYYGDIRNVGLVGTYDINEDNSIDFNIDHTKEDMERHTTSVMSQIYKRDITRDKKNLTWNGRKGNTDWKLSYNWAKMTSDDMGLLSSAESNPNTGKNVLFSVDDLQHKEWNVTGSANTQINDKHLLSYGFGYSREKAFGSRLKNAPKTWTESIDPWDYDKNLGITGQTIIADGEQKTVYTPSSMVQARYFVNDENGIPHYDYTYDVYGYKNPSTGLSEAPAYTAEMYNTYGYYTGYNDFYEKTPADVIEAYEKFRQQLVDENENKYYEQYGDFGKSYFSRIAVSCYYNDSFSTNTTWHGAKYAEMYTQNHNKVIRGMADLKKYNFWLQDNWQINDKTVLTPSLRLDHSELFGSNITFNLGMTHHVGGKANHRLKANVGTSYAEPGIGELYYNWEMYPGMTIDDGVGRLGYYWVGNPNLKPEKAVNVDLGYEAENGNTSMRFDVFHNRIKDYMSIYFTGYLMDFYPEAKGGDKFLNGIMPDLLYSFKNIGRADITGAEVSLEHRFNNHWRGKLGYTYLHAINKSDPDMPDRLLNKPTHKIDIGLTYENKGWTASLWGNYYIHMLDSNTLAGNGNMVYLDPTAPDELRYDIQSGKQRYAEKTFCLWNLLVSKDIGKDSTVYVGVDNIFNHRDDDQAFQERVYKFGVNLKFGPDGHTMEKALDKAAGKATVEDDSTPTLDTDWFIQAPFDTAKEEGVEVIGDYRARWNSYLGKTKPQTRTTAYTAVGDGAKNNYEKAGHGFDQRLRLGIDARIGDNTNVKILGSASGMSGVDTKYDAADSKGFNHQMLENVDITQHANKWDFSIGRLTEPMGVTGYWFGKEFDGARAVWTSGKNQVRLGYGDFSHSTGIEDSAYNHIRHAELFYRMPSKNEWLGIYFDKQYQVSTIDGYQSLYDKIRAASTVEERLQIVKDALQTIKEKAPDEYDAYLKDTDDGTVNHVLTTFTTIGDKQYLLYNKVTVTAEDGTVLGTYVTRSTPTDSYRTMDECLDENHHRESYYDLGDVTTQSGVYTNSDNTMVNVTIRTEPLGYGYSNATYKDAYAYSIPYTNKKGKVIYRKYSAADYDSVIPSVEWTSADTIWENARTNLFLADDAPDKSIEQNIKAAYLFKYLLTNMFNYWRPEGGSALPISYLDANVPVYDGSVLVRDRIPAIERAAFIQYKHQIGNTLGLQAWYLRSTDNARHSFESANGHGNDIATFDDLANIIGVGVKWRIGTRTTVSYDWGQNRTDFGRYMNGHTRYNSNALIGDYDSFAGHENGGTPRFWVARIDIGRSDTDKPGSWNAFVDYKYFQHGSFFGGNGTEGVPDRYLDGIKSFTIGGGYVPAKNLLIEAFYTFGAKGTGKRDTLYGAENFTLGDYTRVQMTYKF